MIAENPKELHMLSSINENHEIPRKGDKLFYYEIIEMAVLFIGIIGVVIPSVGIPLVYSYKKRKLEEEHKTNNIALAYQILSQRPEVTMDEVKELIVLSGGAEPPKIETSQIDYVNRI